MDSSIFIEEGLIQLFNQFLYYNIKQIYDVNKKLWEIK